MPGRGELTIMLSTGSEIFSTLNLHVGIFVKNRKSCKDADGKLDCNGWRSDGFSAILEAYRGSDHAPGLEPEK